MVRFEEAIWAERPNFGRAVSFSWRAVERDFHNDNRLSWWLAHLSLPLKKLNVNSSNN